MITLKLTDSINLIEKKVNKAIAEEVNRKISLGRNKLLVNCKSLVSQWILDQPEIQSLKSNNIDSLAGQLGLYPGQGDNFTYAIILAIENSVNVQLQTFTESLIGGVYVNFQPSNFLNLLGLGVGTVYYEGGRLPWLQWLLEKGDSIIVVNYQYNPQTGLGRSGLGNMITGGSFRIPPEFSGTIDDNFITRALVGTNQANQIANIFKKILGA